MGSERLRAVHLSADLESWPTGRLLVVAGRMAYQGIQDLLAAYGVTPAGVHVLGTLRNGPSAQIDVAARCGVQTQTAGRTIARLVRQGLVTRRRDPADRRRWVIELTDHGRRLVTTLDNPARPPTPRGTERPQTLEPSIFEDLDDADRFRADLIRIIRRLLASQAAGRAAQWTAVAERWAAYDTEEGGRTAPHEEMTT